jgi:hypothetical protein
MHIYFIAIPIPDQDRCTVLMDTDRIFAGVENLVSVLHIAILFLSALMFTFVFIINWEDWFFNVKLAGPAAGLFLAAKAAGAVILVFLVTQYPDRWKAVLPASIAYFGFLFVNATVTYQTTAPGSFPVLLAVLVIIPVLLLVLKLRSAGLKKPITTYEGDAPPCTPPDKDKTRGINPLLVLFLGIIVVMVFVILIVPLVISLIVSNVPSLHQMAFPPARDSLITRFSPEGTMEWQVAIKGYNLGTAEVVSVPDDGYIIFGPYWISSENGLVNRAVYIDRHGTMVWDWRRIADNRPDMDIPDTIQTIISENGEFLILLDNGRTIRLDFRGNTISEGITTDEERSQEAGILFPDSIGVSPLPAPSASVRVRSENGQNTLLTIKDTVSHKEIQNVDVVNPTPDGGYLVSASVKP